MQMLKDRILKDGMAIDSNVLKVDSFLNHQVDVKLLNEIGKEFKRIFKDKEVTKILTIEASGIAIACIAAQYFNVPVVFAKKYSGNNIDKETYESEVFSFTKNRMYNIKVSKKYLSCTDKVLLIDDFFANGRALHGLGDVVRQAGAEIVGAGIVIEKAFQKGRDLVEQDGIRIESLAIIEKMDKDLITFKS